MNPNALYKTTPSCRTFHPDTIGNLFRFCYYDGEGCYHFVGVSGTEKGILWLMTENDVEEVSA